MLRHVMIARTLPRLGLRNVARVGCYRLRLKVGFRPQPLPYACPKQAVFEPRFSERESDQAPDPTTLALFGWFELRFNEPPDWHADPFGRAPRMNPDQDWVQALNTIGNGDVKTYWELSRFYWLPQFALAARHGDRDAAVRMEHWVQNWIASNPPFRGINWACGQEAAIRLMNLALAALILDLWHSPSPTLKWLIETHARRIHPTLSYALGQDNNHGTAEACALFIAGTWGQSWAMPGAARLARTGRKWLNNRALRMIQPDGSPCQYSTTYHRANLEVFCMAQLWSARTGIQGLNENSVKRVAAGASWLHAIIDPVSGDAPNIGANDGSHLFNVTHVNYRDFRPTVALASALFSKARPWAEYTDARLAELGIQEGKLVWSPAISQSSDNGGFHILRCGETLAMMRYPRFRFRPSHADALHVDLWRGGINLLRDAGTYSYESGIGNWFSGTSAHNTITFDNRDQMPRIGRFLFGDWLKTDHVEAIRVDGTSTSAAAAYIDPKGAKHHRKIVLSENGFTCYDAISGSFIDACLRWRLAPDNWWLEGDTVRSKSCSITIQIDGKKITPTLDTTMESRYYLHQAKVPEISVNVNRPVELITKINF